MAIETALTIRMVFRLPHRQIEGFRRGLTEMLDVELPIPDHTTLSRRLKKLHLAVNADTGEVLAAELTNRRTEDCARMPNLLDQVMDRKNAGIGAWRLD